MKLDLSPWTALILALFIWLCGMDLLLAVLFAAFFHEMGHYFLLRHFGAAVKTLRITIFGAEMEIANNRLSYGREILATLAGPAVNLLLALLLAWFGRWWERAYLFSGAQFILGLFNLLPLIPLDGGRLLWLLVAWLREPYTADKLLHELSVCFTAVLVCGGLFLWVKEGSPFFFVGALGLAGHNAMKKGL